MPEFTVDFTRVLKISGRHTFKARDLEAAEEKAEEVVGDIMNETTMKWEVTTDKKAYKDVEWGVEGAMEEEDVEDIEVSEG